MVHPYLSFSDSTYTTGKVVGTSASNTAGNGLTDSSITNVVIPSSYDDIKVVEIGYHSFYKKTSIVSVFIPKTVQHICYEAFYGCTKLSEVKFEAGSELKKMEKDVFQNDNSITKIDIPPSLEDVDYDSDAWIFYGVTSLICFSYFGSTDFSNHKVFHNNPEVHVSDLMYPKGKKFGEKDVIRDDKSCGISNFKIKSLKCRYSILIRDHYPNISRFLIFLLISS